MHGAICEQDSRGWAGLAVALNSQSHNPSLAPLLVTHLVMTVTTCILLVSTDENRLLVRKEVYGGEARVLGGE